MCFLWTEGRQPASSFQTATHAALQGSETHTEGSTIYTLLHVQVHRQPRLASVAVIDIAESTFIPPIQRAWPSLLSWTSGYGWLWHYLDSNLQSPDDKVEKLVCLMCENRHWVEVTGEVWRQTGTFIISTPEMYHPQHGRSTWSRMWSGFTSPKSSNLIQSLGQLHVILTTVLGTVVCRSSAGVTWQEYVCGLN